MNIDTNWHSWNEELLSQTLKTDAARGLSQKAASRRMAKNGPNRIWSVKRASVSEFAVQMLLDLATILLVIFAVIAAVFDRSSETLAICTVIVAGGALRIFTYIKARRVFEEKARGVIPRIRVIRDAEAKIMTAEKLVEGDVIFLEAGDTVPADARIIYSADLLVYENKMTENKNVVFKNSAVINEDGASEIPIEKRDNMLYAGSTVVSGEARAIVVATGKNTLACSKYGTLIIPAGEKLRVIEKLTRWCRMGSLTMIVAVAVITVAAVFIKNVSVVDIFLSTLSLAVASMSEFFTVLGYIVIAISVWKADSEESGRAKIKDAASVEVMNETDTIVLESPEMIKAGDITLTSYFQGDRLVNVDESVDGYSPAELLRLAYLTTGTLPQGTVTAGRLEAERESISVDYSGIHKVYEEYFRFTNESRFIENVIIAGHEPAGSLESGGLDTTLICRGGNFEAVVSGTVNEVLTCCSHIRKGGRVLPITREDVSRIVGESEKLRKRGVFTVGVSSRNSPYSNMNRVSALQMCMIFEGFLSLSDRVHGDALDVIRKCREGDTAIVCFTEGSPEDKAFLEAVGILGEKDRYITLEEALSCQSITLEKGQFAVIATGVAGAHKRRREFLRKLKSGGSKTAYISKEPRDMWSMKEADVSFAVPEAATIKKTIPQSIRAAAHVVVTPAGNGGGVFEAFRVLEFAKSAMLNLRRCADYLIAAQAARLLYVIATAVSPFSVADPVHLLFWGLLVDFGIVIVTAFRDPPWNMISVGKEKRRLHSKFSDFVYPFAVGVIWTALIMAAPTVLLCVGHAFGREMTGALLSNMIFVSAMLAAPIVGTELMTNGSIFKRSKRRSNAIPLMHLVMLVLSLLFAFWKGLSAVTGSESLDLRCYLICFIPSVLLLVIFEIRKLLKGRSTGAADENEAEGETDENEADGDRQSE